MKIICILAALLAAKSAYADVVLNEKVMKLALLSADLSMLAYEKDPPGDGFEHFGYYDEEPDQALVGERDGYCFAAFRGTTMTMADWGQNLQLGMKDICKKGVLGAKQCCSTRSGFYEAYYTPDYHAELEVAIRKCAKTCADPNECVVFTGHSQGGAIAAVAGLELADLNPYVITFGQPRTIEYPCSMISSERWYRFVNSIADDGIAYDPIPMVPGMGADSFGHMIMLGEDPTGVAYIGLDANDSFGPMNLAFYAHSMEAPPDVPFPGYMDRLQALMENAASFPIRANGFADNTLCSQSQECESGSCGKETSWSETRCIGTECTEDEHCLSDRCEYGSCVPKLGSCMSCDEDSDCAGGKCLSSKCSGSNGLMDDNCICTWDTDCNSGRCERLETSNCEAQLAFGAVCNEDSDCKSSFCSWKFQCDELKAAGAYCSSSSDCQSGKCNWRFKCAAGENKARTSAVAMAMPTQHASSIHLWFGGRMVLAVVCVVGVMKYAVPSYRRYQNGYDQIAATELAV